VLELSPLSIGVIRVQARGAAIEGIAEHGDAIVLRLSTNEVLLLCGPDDEVGLLEQVCVELEQRDPSALAIADRDSFAAWALGGPNVEEALARLSAIPLPRERPGVAQGLVADVPTKVVVAGDDVVILLVGSPVSHHIRARALEACAAVGIVERDLESFSPQLARVS
jgi:hypothetical protein